MKVLLIHPNFPGQYAHVMPALAARAGNRVVGIGARSFPVPEGVDLRVYDPPPPPEEAVPPRLRPAQAALARAERVARIAIDLRREGFRPDAVLGHIGWGDTIFIKDIFPEAPFLLYAEFFYSATGADVGHEPGKPATLQDAVRLRAMNMPMLSAMQAADWGAAPTRWQRERFPEWFRQKISLVHEGVDTDLCRPDPEARFDLPDGTVLRRGDEVVTYVARGLEPYRGFPTFMRALPTLLAARPAARVVIVGGDQASYGRAPESAATWREAMLAELGPLDPARVHFLGRIPHPALHALFRVSAAHVYLTVPFVLSWSVLEAMACGALVIGSATPPVQEVIEDGVNGLLTDLYDPAPLAARLAEVLADPARHAPLRAAARRTVEKRFDLRRVCLPRQMAVIEALAARKRPLTYA
ncbi:glycosyltransferase family 4 protein [Muricoccus vinaceus]|uniref:Glycosyltransferase family 4 protein n=1 Tax=Muricoccus vinaceus TaxID=424704 RepID=A0ABV6IQI7_9PROT